MKPITLLAILLAPLGAVAAPAPTRTTSLYGRLPPSKAMSARSWVVTPPPCVALDPAPSEEETEARFDEFADALIVQRNLTRAFEYISATYINHDPAITGDGPNAALDGLSMFWNFTTLTPLRQTFIDDQGWLNYQASGIGTIVDRFRFEAGCIVEHFIS
ncbi:60S ribosomal protein L28 [Hypoxylon texense]